MRRLSSFKRRPVISFAGRFSFFGCQLSLSRSEQPQEPTTISREVKDVFERAPKPSSKSTALINTASFPAPVSLSIRLARFTPPTRSAAKPKTLTSSSRARNIRPTNDGRSAQRRRLVESRFGQPGIADWKFGPTRNRHSGCDDWLSARPVRDAELRNDRRVRSQMFRRLFSDQTFAGESPPQRGEGGAPLLNLKGEVVGICFTA